MAQPHGTRPGPPWSRARPWPALPLRSRSRCSVASSTSPPLPPRSPSPPDRPRSPSSAGGRDSATPGCTRSRCGCSRWVTSCPTTTRTPPGAGCGSATRSGRTWSWAGASCRTSASRGPSRDSAGATVSTGFSPGRTGAGSSSRTARSPGSSPVIPSTSLARRGRCPPSSTSAAPSTWRSRLRRRGGPPRRATPTRRCGGSCRRSVRRNGAGPGRSSTTPSAETPGPRCPHCTSRRL